MGRTRETNTTERVREISEYLYQLAISLNKESYDTDDPQTKKELDELADLVIMISDISKSKEGLTLGLTMNDMLLSREMIKTLRQKERNGELNQTISEMLDLDEGGDEDKDDKE